MLLHFLELSSGGSNEGNRLGDRRIVSGCRDRPLRFLLSTAFHFFKFLVEFLTTTSELTHGLAG